MNNSSLASDLTRIVLLGIAFDVSRSVARGVLGALSSRFYGDDASKECLEGKAKQDSAQTQAAIFDRRPRERDSDDKNQREQQLSATYDDGANHIISSLALASVGIIERWKKQVYNTVHDNNRLGLCCYLLLPPPLLIYGAWDYVLCRNNNKVQHPNPIHNFGGMYLSSIITSFGLLLWMSPFMWGSDDAAVVLGEIVFCFHDSYENGWVLW